MEQLPLVPEAAELPAPEGTVRAADVVHCAPEHEKLKHYLLVFHDDCFECLAEKHSVEVIRATFRQALERTVTVIPPRYLGSTARTTGNAGDP